jgi:hypothetical protein
VAGNPFGSLNPSLADIEMFRRNAEFYEQNPTSTLKLTPLPWTTQYKRRVYKDQHGGIHSESTTTVQDPRGGWMNIPLIYGGAYVTPDRARDMVINNGMIDPDNGEPVRNYATQKDAIEAAKQRMRTLNRPDQKWNQ